VTVVAHSPTGHGALHRGTDDSQGGEPLTALLDEIAAAHELTRGQVALAWVHDRERVHDTPVVPLPGTTSVAHVRANAAMADLPLSPAEVERLDEASQVSRGSGTR
jgi:aryl-alcohol dehydrogenase-like predicted oxidoreductase